MDTATDEFVGEQAEPAFDLIHPTRAGRSEVDVDAGDAEPAMPLISGVLWVA